MLHLGANGARTKVNVLKMVKVEGQWKLRPAIVEVGGRLMHPPAVDLHSIFVIRENRDPLIEKWAEETGRDLRLKHLHLRRGKD